MCTGRVFVVAAAAAVPVPPPGVVFIVFLSSSVFLNVILSLREKLAHMFAAP